MLGVAACMAACQGEKKSESELNLEGEWLFQTVEGDSIAAGEEEVFLGLNTADSTLYGCTGCNRLLGSFTFDYETQTITFENLGSTRMMCENMESEAQVMAALQSTTAFDIEGDVLSLSNGEETVATLVKR